LKRKRPVARLKRRFDDNIKSNLQAIQRGLLLSALWWAFVNGTMEFRVSYKEGKMSSTAERVASSQLKLSFVDVYLTLCKCRGKAARRSMIDMDIFYWKFQLFW
jgi:hypothetical protein